VEVLPADLTDPDQLATVEARLADAERPVDLLVNNAGFGTAGPFVELSVEGEEAEIRLNVVALVRLTRAAVPGMVERGRGAVLNMSSLAALQPLPYSATYAATKAYVTSFSHALHEELRGTGVQVLALMPGFTRTNFQARSGNERSTIPGPLWMSAEAVAAEGLAALARGRVAYVPGARYRVVAAISRMTPWAVTRRVVAAVEQRSYPSSN
jgi:short-subunit dehydrogenase